MIESVALLTARIAKRLEEDYPAFTEAMFEASYSHFLQPLPSYSIARVDSDNRRDKHRILTVPRGMLMRSAKVKDENCKFRSMYEVVLGPVTISGARFSPVISAPKGMQLPPTASSCISIELDGTALVQESPELAKLRLFIDGEPSFRAALIDALFLHGTDAYVQAGDDGPWRKVDGQPVALVGFSEDDAMLPDTARSQPAFRLLTEYFCYSEKFNFIDVDLAKLARLAPPGSKRLTLHLPLAGLGADSDAARLLAALSPAKLLLGCTPVINLFNKPGEPVQIWETSADFAVIADRHGTSAYEVHSILKVQLGHQTSSGYAVTEFTPLYGAIGDASAGVNAGNHWIGRRDAATAAVSPGHEYRIALIEHGIQFNNSRAATLSTDLLVTNRDLPTQLGIGAPDGDLSVDHYIGNSSIRLLRKPSAPCRFTADKGNHWRLISHLTLNHSTVDSDGLGDLRAMLSLYNLTRSMIAQRQINGIVDLECGAVRAWVGTHPVACLMPGIGIRMTVDEQAFAGSALYTFALLMDHYFSLNGQLNCFTQLDIVSRQTGEEILKCKPRSLETARS
jgi:type VI secretion system protein ImpG